MNRLRHLIVWIWKLWPVIIIGLLLLIHRNLINCLPFYENDIHKFISLVTQIGGGLIVLYSIDSNIGIIKEKNLLGVFFSYLKECPLRTENHVILNSKGIGLKFGGSAKLSMGRDPKTIEERIEYLQEQITEVKKELKSEAKKLNDKIDKKMDILKKEIQETHAELGKFKRQVEDISIGGIKVQLFGVVLMIYGAVSAYIA